MVWSGTGPEIFFSTPNNLSTSVIVDQYGTYNFNFMGCAQALKLLQLNLLQNPQK